MSGPDPVEGGEAMTTAAESADQGAPKKRGFSLPSAYTILFILIVVVAALTWVVPSSLYW